MIFHHMPQIQMALNNSPLTPGNSPLFNHNGSLRAEQCRRIDEYRPHEPVYTPPAVKYEFKPLEPVRPLLPDMPKTSQLSTLDNIIKPYDGGIGNLTFGQKKYEPFKF